MIKKILLITIIFLPNYSCKNKLKSDAREDLFYVQTQKITKKDLREEIVLSGTIKAMDEAIIFPRTSGKLVKNLVKEGDVVKKDDTIALIKKDEVGVVYEPAPVPSTLDGIIGRIYQDVGADVNPQTPIALVVNQDKIRVQVDIPERYTSDIYNGQKIYIKLESYSDKIFYGKLDKISPVIDKISRTFLAEAVFENKNHLLKSGMTCEVHIILKEVKSAIAIPISAMVIKNNKKYIYLVDREKNIAIEKEIIAGLQNTDYIEAKNIKEGSEIIVLGNYGIKNGSKIKIVD